MAEIRLDELKSNSRSRRAETGPVRDEDTERRVDHAASGKTHTARKGFGRKFMETFFEGDIHEVKTYLIYDVIKPAIKENLADMINAAVGMMLFNEVRRGGGRSRGNGSGGNGTRVNYGGYFTNGGSSRKENMPTYRNSDVPGRVDELMKESRGEAEEVLAILEEVLDQYDQITVVDYYDAFGVTSTNFQDNKFGWKSLDGVMVKRVPRAIYDEESRRYIDGFMLTMPREVALGK